MPEMTGTRRRKRRQRMQRLLERARRLRHERRMEGIRHRQAAAKDAATRSRRADSVNGRHITRHHRLIGQLILATTTVPCIADKSSSAIARGQARLAIAPVRSGRARITRPRSAAIANSASASNAPATCSAVISPRLCPPTTAGWMPSDCRNARTEPMRKQIAGCATSVADKHPAHSSISPALRARSTGR